MAPTDLEVIIGQAAVGTLPGDSSPTTNSPNSVEMYSQAVKQDKPVESTPSGGDVEGANLVGPVVDVVDFRTMRWWNVGILMIAETVSLGILALPSATSKLGFFPGLFMIGIFGLIATYTGWVIGQFKLAHPTVHNMADAGQILFLPLGARWANFGRRLFSAGSIMFLVFIMAAHILSFSIMLNVVTGHNACTIWFMIAGAIASFTLCLPRTLEKVSWISVASLISIVVAVFITIVGVGILHPHGTDTAIAINDKLSFATAMVAIMDIVMAYAGNVAFFGFISEMRNPEEYTKALWMVQGSATTLYLIVAAVIYHFAGAYVASPALGSASPVLQKVAYVVAIPTILVAGVINGHVALTMIFKTFRAPLVASRSWKACIWWVSLAAALWTAAWVLAESIPHFDNLLGLVSALFGSWFTYGISGALWLSMNWKRRRESWWMVVGIGLNLGLLVMAAGLCVLGTYASVLAISGETGGHAWSCNSNI